MSGRAATTDQRPGRYALSVGLTEMPAPPGWYWVELQQAARLESGHTPSRKFPSYWNGGIPWIGIKDARNHHGKQIFSTLQTVSQEGLDNSAARLLPAGTVCLSRTASVGYSLVLGESMATSQDFVNWICSDVVDPEFLMHLFIAEKESLLRFGKGTTHTTIYYPEVKAFHVCLPPKREQRAIVQAIESYFTRLDDAVATLERVQRNQKRYRASVLKAAVEGRLVPTEAELARAEGRDYEPASVLLERILAERRRRWEEAELAKMQAKRKAPKDDKWKAKYREPVEPDSDCLPELPKGWCWSTIDALLREPLRNGHSAKEAHDGDVRTLTLSAVTARDFSERNTKLTAAAPDYVRDLWLESGDIFVERSNTPELVGTAALFQGPSGFAIFPDLLIRVRPAEHALPVYVEAALRSSRARAYFQRAAKGIAGTMPKISQDTVASCPVPLPPIAEQFRIVRELERQASVSEDAETTVAKARARCIRLRQSILKWAFEGRLVDQDPTDEPASRLLERIQAERESTNGLPRRSPRRPRARSPKA